MSFDRNDPAHLAALKAEATNDPLAIGYTVIQDGNTNNFISQINAKNYTVAKPKISSADVRAATTYDAYNNLSIDEQEWLVWMTGSNGANEENMAVTEDLRAQLTTSSTFWAVGDRSAMQAAMLALIDVSGSRAEVLWGYGTNISREDWLAAEIS
jgi:hypothetical protein